MKVVYKSSNIQPWGFYREIKQKQSSEIKTIQNDWNECLMEAGEMITVDKTLNTCHDQLNTLLQLWLIIDYFSLVLVGKVKPIRFRLIVQSAPFKRCVKTLLLTFQVLKVLIVPEHVCLNTAAWSSSLLCFWSIFNKINKGIGHIQSIEINCNEYSSFFVKKNRPLRLCTTSIYIKSVPINIKGNL